MLIIAGGGKNYLKDGPYVIYLKRQLATIYYHCAIGVRSESFGLPSFPPLSVQNMTQSFLSLHLRGEGVLYSDIFVIIGGVIAGIWGFTGLTGFIFYQQKRSSLHRHTLTTGNRILLDGFFGGLMSFVLFWTFAYDIVHIF
ncbi:unnamed protein product [Spirodela intermedia]|uniref:ER membrane protein complex subunit 6 n=1 Tax=Spirodela intermedia TaxID=51605 RepID=A0A7I8JK54_SPIIN|nr:unnamed protein product [Spirodela intermedia]CAA6670518.1 unnamed protein product [Spirodela intermedia]